MNKANILLKRKLDLYLSDVLGLEDINIEIAEAYILYKHLLESKQIFDNNKDYSCEICKKLNKEYLSTYFELSSLIRKTIQTKDEYISFIKDIAYRRPRSFRLNETSHENLNIIITKLLGTNKGTGEEYVDFGSGCGASLIEVALNCASGLKSMIGIELYKYPSILSNILLDCLQLVLDYKIGFEGIKNTDIKEYLNDKPKTYNLAYLNLGLEGSIKNRNTNWEFINKIINNTIRFEKLAVVLPESELLFYSDRHENIGLRNSLLEKGYINTIYSLPRRSFSSYDSCLVIFSKDNKYVNYVDCKDIDIDNYLLLYEHMIRLYKYAIKVKNSDLINESNITPSYILEKESIENEDNCVTLESLNTDITVCPQIYRSEEVAIKNKDNNSTTTYKLLTPDKVNEHIIYEDNLLDCNDTNNDYKKYYLKPLDIIVTNKTTKIKTSIYEGMTNKIIIPLGSLIIIRVDKDKINPYYLAAYLDSINGKKKLSLTHKSGNIFVLSEAILAHLSIPLLDKEKQNKIANEYKTYLANINKSIKDYEINVNNISLIEFK